MKLKNVIDKIEKSKNLIELIIMFITAICTVIGVYLGFAQINSILKEQRFSNRLELADDLMSEYMTLSSHGSKAVFYLVADANGEADELIKIDSNYPNYMQMHSEELENIKGKIAAYGSTELVNLFFDSYNSIQMKLENGKGDLESYKYYFYSMPLLASCIRYDLTGEKVNPSIFYNSSMRELKTLEAASGMEDFHEKMISTNDELVEKYGLPKKFIWKE